MKLFLAHARGGNGRCNWFLPMRRRAHALLLDCLRDERAQGVTEYGVLVGVFALGALVTLIATGDRCRLFLQLLDRRLDVVSR